MTRGVRGADRPPAGTVAAAEWEQIEQAAPALAGTMRRYLAQAATFLAPRSVTAADGALRQPTRWLLARTIIESVIEIRRDDIEDFKVWLSGQDGTNGTLSANTVGLRNVRWSSTPTARPVNQAVDCRCLLLTTRVVRNWQYISRIRGNL